MSGQAYAMFERDVPEHLREDAMTAMAEATQGFGNPDNAQLCFSASAYPHDVFRLKGARHAFPFD